MLSDIGTSGDDTALLCITNRPPPTGSGHSGGEWTLPTGERVGNASGFRTDEAPMIVRLRTTGSETPTDGIYCCQIMDKTDALQTVYVGLYSNGGGNLKNVFLV